jgi:tRNA pseudouridine55 synthase
MSKRPDPTLWRDVHGILLLDKPPGPSSNQALQQAKRLFRAAKAGHTGSLDPMATGLLPVCFGEATKIAGYLLGSAKAYYAELKLGVTTATGDADGEVVRTRAVPPFAREVIEAALVPLRGRITQVPPVYSAIKQGGEPLYAKARRGEVVHVPPREVEVFRLELLSGDVPGSDRLCLEVECGSGTYVRSLAVDLGEILGCGAHLTALRRRWVDPFRAPRMFTLEEVAEAAASCDPARLEALLLPLESGLTSLPALRLGEDAARRLMQGQAVAVEVVPAELCRVQGADGRLLALGEVDNTGSLRVRRGFN